MYREVTTVSIFFPNDTFFHFIVHGSNNMPQRQKIIMWKRSRENNVLKLGTLSEWQRKMAAAASLLAATNKAALLVR